MTIASDLHTALAPTITMLTREFGTRVTVRQQAPGFAADGSATLLDRKAPGFNDPISIILTPISQSQAVREWGINTDVTVVGYVSDAITLDPTYRLVVETGPLIGQVFAEVDRKPEPTGGIVTLGLRKVG